MKLSAQQALNLFRILEDTLDIDDENLFVMSREARRDLLLDIVAQQDANPKDLSTGAKNASLDYFYKGFPVIPNPCVPIDEVWCNDGKNNTKYKIGDMPENITSRV